MRLIVRPWGKEARLVGGWLVAAAAAAAAPVAVVEVVDVVPEVRVG